MLGPVSTFELATLFACVTAYSKVLALEILQEQSAIELAGANHSSRRQPASTQQNTRITHSDM